MSEVMTNDDDIPLIDTPSDSHNQSVLVHSISIDQQFDGCPSTDQPSAAASRYAKLLHCHRLARKRRTRVEPYIDSLDWLRRGNGWDTGDTKDIHESNTIDPSIIQLYQDFAAKHKLQVQILQKPQNNPTSTYDEILDVPQVTTTTPSHSGDQSDTGANCNATPFLHKLRNLVWIKSTTLNSAEAGSSMEVLAMGQYDLTCDNECLTITMFYCPSLANTIISPTTVAEQHKDRFIGFHQYANMDQRSGFIVLAAREGYDNIRWNLALKNGLWYHSNNSKAVHHILKLTTDLPDSSDPEHALQISALSNAARYELWHQRLAHAGTWVLENCHKHCIGIPKLNGNSFYKCPSCMSGKLSTKQNPKKTATLGTEIDYNHYHHTSTDAVVNEYLDEIHLPDAEPGQHFHMDFGFVSGFEEDGNPTLRKNTTSIDGYRSYLLIVDRKTRYMWVHLSTTKEPPLDAARLILRKFKCENPHRTVRTDQDKSLAKSNDFKKMVEQEEFTLEITGTDNSRQNSPAERPHRTLAQMMRCMLHSAGLGPEYWSFALQQAVWIKNRIPHQSLNQTPYEALTGTKPDLSQCRIFGSRIYAKATGLRRRKLDHHSRSGIFLRFTATPQNVTYLDEKSGLIKTGTHVIFDEAHMSTPASKAPLAAEALQRLGYSFREDWVTKARSTSTSENLQVLKLSKSAQVPVRSSSDSIGYDLFADMEVPMDIKPSQLITIPTGIALTPPSGTYIRLAPRSGLTMKKQLDVKAGVIDPDYTGEILILLHNFGKETQRIEPGMKIAQFIVENSSCPIIEEVKELKSTHRGNNGFGSTDQPTIAAATMDQANIHQDLHFNYKMPYDIEFTHLPFDNFTTRDIATTGKDELLGLHLQFDSAHDYPILLGCKPGTPAARIKRWRSELQRAYLLEINGKAVHNIDEARSIIQQAQKNQEKNIKILLATTERQSIHPQLGVPQLYHDQMNILAKHLWEMKNSPEWNTHAKEAVDSIDLHDALSPKELKRLAKLVVHKITKQKKLTRRILKQKSDWNDWQKSEFKQLDQYKAQNTFGPPEPRPPNENVLNLLWTYLIKDDGTKKARCVCNGSKNMRGSVTLAETYAAALDQTGAKIFWAAAALQNFIIIGADASNAFAEAPAPVAPLYVVIDEQYREWHRHRCPNAPEIPTGHVMKVKGALQGHPESARLWALLIDKVIRDLNLKPCSHEPNLYYCSDYNNTGKKLLFLRQVDDFAVACEDKKLAQEVISAINSKMSIEVKELGLVTRYNGVDISQTRHYIKLSNQTYLDKIAKNHPWLKDLPKLAIPPTPMIEDSQYQTQLETAIPFNDKERTTYEQNIGFTYRQAIGEIIYAVVTCRPDIAFACLKLSQYSAKPAEIHYEAVKRLLRYLMQTKDEGIYYWRDTPRYDLPLGPLPVCHHSNNYKRNEITLNQSHKSIIHAAVDSDFASDKSHRKSVSGICIKLAGGTILYKTKFQPTVALSSTEAEFNAAVEAGKYILYVRTILEEIGLAQEHASILYEDNQGALLMANAQRPTKNTKHIDIKHFALQDWVQDDLLKLKRIDTSDNYSDVFTKATGTTLFYRHNEYVMGKVIPEYALKCINKLTLSLSTLSMFKRTQDTLEHGRVLDTG
jgi:deoxyuridine 5'-triphosphate nucleotidohydrolase